ncbi:MAG: hypothetical protein V1717_00205 [Candidatus Micrarchaeota archaeon]
MKLDAEEKHGDLEEKTVEELIRLGYSPSILRQSMQALQTLHEFVQFIGTNQYYSENISKKIFYLSLDLNHTVLGLEELALRERTLIDEVQKAVVLKSKPAVDSKKIAGFRKQAEDLENQVLELTANAKKLVKEIKDESVSKQHFFESK